MCIRLVLAAMTIAIICPVASAQEPTQFHLHVAAYRLPRQYTYEYEALAYRIDNGRRAWAPRDHEMRTTVFTQGAIRIGDDTAFTLIQGAAQWRGPAAPVVKGMLQATPQPGRDVIDHTGEVGKRSHAVVAASDDKRDGVAKEAWFLYSAGGPERAGVAVFRMDLAVRRISNDENAKAERVRFTKLHSLTYHTTDIPDGEKVGGSNHECDYAGLELPLGDALAVMIESNHEDFGSVLLVVRVATVDLTNHARARDGAAPTLAEADASGG